MRERGGMGGREGGGGGPMLDGKRDGGSGLVAGGASAGAVDRCDTDIGATEAEHAGGGGQRGVKE
jgi:hypothetical protein